MKFQARFVSITSVLILAVSTVHSLEEWKGRDVHYRHSGLMKHVKANMTGLEAVSDSVAGRMKGRNVVEERHEKKVCRSDKVNSHNGHDHHIQNHYYHKHHRHHLHLHHHHHHHHHDHDQLHHHPHHPHQKQDEGSYHPSSEHQESHHGKAMTSSSGNHGKGLEGRVYHGKCTQPNASDKYPNGNIHFLNCNIENGWDPVPIKSEDLSIASPDDVVQGDVFKPCHKYLAHFKAVAAEHNIHATLLMSFAMQESHCDAGLKGPNGEIGMMQIIPENCKGDCWDVNTNIRIAAALFTKMMAEGGGNLLLAIGSYNGWYRGLTVSQAKNEQFGCASQNNLDYIYQMLNGWLQGKDGYSKEFCIYNNLAHCG